MATTIFYLSIIIGSTFFVWCSSKIGNKLIAKICLLISFAMIFIPSAIRYDIGKDYLSYIRIYVNNESKDLGFDALNVVLKSLNLDPQAAIAAYAFLFIYPIYKTYNSKDSWIFHFIFFLSYLLISFNLISQAIAISICVIATNYLLNNKFIQFVLLGLVASSIHPSAFLIVLLGFVSKVKLSSTTIRFFIPTIFLLISMITILLPDTFLEFIRVFLNVVGLGFYGSYFNSDYFVATEGGTGLGVIINLIFSIYFIINSKYILAINKNYKFVIILIYMYILSTLLSDLIEIFYRARVLFTFAPVLASLILLKLPYNRKLNKFVVFSFSLFLIASLIKISDERANYDNDARLNPYTHIYE